MAQRKPARKASPDSSQPTIPAWLAPATCATLAFAVYANTLTHGFITDDQFQILSNPVVTGSRSLFSAFGSGVWAFLGYRGNYFRPIQFLVYGLIFRTFGPNAFAFHLLMVLLHAANTALVYAVARRLLAGRLPSAAWVSAALFAVHPIHTEAVNWIAALPDVLVTTFALTGLLAFAKQDAAPNSRQSAAHAAIYLAALLTKETGVMLLPLYVAYQWMRGSRRNWGMYAAMGAALVAYLAMRVHALGGLAPAQQAFFHLTAAQFAMSAAVLAARYLLALFLPVDLNFFHVFHATTGVSLEFLAAGTALGAVAWLALPYRHREPLVAFTIFWMAAAIAPALNIAGVGQNVFAERYLYLPSAGFVILAGLAWSWLQSASPNWAWPTAVAILLVFSVQTVARNRDWTDDFTLLQVTLKQSPDSGYLHNLMAGAWVQRDQFQKALEEQKLAVQYDPESSVFHKNLGNILLGIDPAAAARAFAAVIAIQPQLAEGHFDLGLAWQAMGDYSKAADEYRRALALDPGYRDAAAALEKLPQPR